MSKKEHDYHKTLIANRLWNLKVEEVQRILSELEALFSYLGMHEVCLNDVRPPGEIVKLKTIINAIFEAVIARSKAV